MHRDDAYNFLGDATYRSNIVKREFIRAMRTGRMMAFVGSFATVELGYGDWEKLLRQTLPITPEWSERLDNKEVPSDYPWVAHAWELLGEKSADRLTVHEILNEFLRSPQAIKAGFSLPLTEDGFRADLNDKVRGLFGLAAGKKKLARRSAVWQLCRNLGVRRIITTNYDLEFEYELMVEEADRWRGVASSNANQAREKIFKIFADDAARKKQQAMRDEAALSRYDFALEHSLRDSQTVVSDCFQRERADKLFEFAIGSPDPAWHIMHLHGRITDPETLIISASDYNRQYRRSSITKLPFQHGMKLLFAGNPILFVGMGMSEEEILSVLRQFVSDGSPGYVAQHFVIWSSDDGRISQKNELFRLRLHVQFGVYVIFDCELPDFSTAPAKADALALSLDGLARFAAIGVMPFVWTDHIHPTLDDKPPRFPFSGELTFDGDFRDMQGYLPGPLATIPGPKAQEAYDARLVGGSIIWQAYNPGNAADEAGTRKRFSQIDIPFGDASSVFDKPLCDASGMRIDPDSYFSHVVTRGSPIKAFIDRPGSGHGNLAAVIGDFIIDKVSVERRQKLEGTIAPGAETLFFQLNGSFTWELDSAFALVSGLFDDRTAFRTQQSRSAATEQFFAQIDAAFSGKGPLLKRALYLVINGADRFFDSSGYPLSNELDLLIRRMPLFRHDLRRRFADKADEKLHHFIHQKNGGLHPVTLLLFGTSRIGRYLASLGFEKGDLSHDGIGDYDIISSKREPFATSEPVPGTFFSQLAKRKTTTGAKGPFKSVKEQSLYLNAVHTAFDNELASAGLKRENIVPAALRSAFARFEGSLETDARRPFFDIHLDATLLAAVLSRKPIVGRERAALALEVLRVMAFLGQPVTLHTLYVALEGARKQLKDQTPVTTTAQLNALVQKLIALKLILEIEQFPGLPETSQFKVRYALHRALLHEIRDRNSVPFSDARNYTSFNIPLFAAQPIDDHEPEDRVQQIMEEMVRHLIHTRPTERAGLDDLAYGMQLRAACASLRSYYTTSTLLMHEPEAFPSERKSPKLYQHADLIDQLIYRAEEAARARRAKVTKSPPNFFSDDLVWLHAQRGVALMAYGDLYGARDSFGKAASINDKFVEFGDHGQNWRRIQINQIYLDIERAKMASAEGRIRDLKTSINKAVDDDTWKASWRARIGEKMPRNAFEAIMQAYGTEPRLRVREVDPFFAADLILSTGLACGYRGWCEYLRGRLRTAEHYFSHCIQILRNIGEQRAYALFARHYASLLDAIGRHDYGREVLLLCQAAADSARQMDISHLAALTRAEHRFSEAQSDERAELLQNVMDTLRYATLTDMYRVRLEARRVLALMRFRDGDYDGALEQASEALAVAARFGFTLRKIALRILVGEILVKRGDPISGAAMLERALRIADRLGYQRAVEEAYRVRAGQGRGQEK